MGRHDAIDTRAARAIIIRAALIAQLLLAAPLGAPVRKPHLYARLGQRNLLRETFARVHVRIVRAFEFLLERVDLFLRKRRSITLQLSLESKPRLGFFVIFRAH